MHECVRGEEMKEKNCGQNASYMHLYAHMNCKRRNGGRRRKRKLIDDWG